MIRPRLLFLGHTLPYPPDRGVALRSYHVLRQLARRYEVDALFFHRPGDPTQMPLDARIEKLEELSRLEAFRIPAEGAVARRRWDELRSLVMRRPEARWRYSGVGFRRSVLEVCMQRDPDIVHLDSIALYGQLPLLDGRTVVVSHHRPESEHLRLRSELSRGVAAWYLARQAEWMARVEREWLPRVSANIVTSEEDRVVLEQRAPSARVEMVPAAVDTEHFTPVSGTGHGLAFVGGTRAPANRDALRFFADEILPRLRSASGVQALEPISWVGSSRPGDRERYRERGIDITGYVEDLRPIIRPAACYVVPRRAVGGGTRVLQAWAMGKAVVSTPEGCQGLRAEDGRNILIRDDAPSFARAVLSVLEDRELRQRLGREARRTVEEHYSWSRTGDSLISLYEELEDAPPLRIRPQRP